MGERKMQSFRLDSDLMARVRAYSDRVGITLTEMVEEGLGAVLDARIQPQATRRFGYPPGYSGLMSSDLDADFRERQRAWDAYDQRETANATGE